MFREWVVDVTMDRPVNDPEMFTTRVFAFCPYMRDSDEVLSGMTLVTDWPEPDQGKVIGIAHMDGQEAVEKWIKDNPDAYKVFEERMTTQDVSE